MTTLSLRTSLAASSVKWFISKASLPGALPRLLSSHTLKPSTILSDPIPHWVGSLLNSLNSPFYSILQFERPHNTLGRISLVEFRRRWFLAHGPLGAILPAGLAHGVKVSVTLDAG